jgi:hypothetical protein
MDRRTGEIALGGVSPEEKGTECVKLMIRVTTDTITKVGALGFGGAEFVS